MSALKWNPTRDASWIASVGSVECEVSKSAEGWWYSCGASDEGTSSLDEAKDNAESKLREMLNDLQQHFAPVLRWVSNGDGESIATIGPWTLTADRGGWTVSAETERNGSQYVASGRGCSERIEHQRAAEAALRSLGVVFRVGGE